MLLLAGCGGGDDAPPPGTPSAAEYLLEPSDLAKAPKGSPQEALLIWWRSIQYNDYDGYLDSLAAPLRRQREADKQLRDGLTLVSGESIRSQPKVVNVQRSGDRATVFTRIETRTPVGSTRFTTSSYPQAFSLVQEGQDWKIADDFYVENRAKVINDAADAAAAEKK